MFGQFAFLGDLGAPELIIILIILLLLFGSKKLPELSKSLGESVKELRNAASGDTPSSNQPQAKKKVGRPPKSDTPKDDKQS
jgi:sec-independent protein translocase protein TatA